MDDAVKVIRITKNGYTKQAEYTTHTGGLKTKDGTVSEQDKTIRELPSKDRHSLERSEVDQIVLECRLTEHLQNELVRCNKQFKNFQLRLEMD